MNSVRTDRVIGSALWAAAGDALGWMTELTDLDGVRRRTGSTRVSEPTQWKRKVGGFRGVDVVFPAGSYSDDTQLRLAVCRSISAKGIFDVEAFAKIELTVWPSYALGAGRGTKAAAGHLAKRDVNWFSNFFARRNSSEYSSAGGNGAAMRIQPHVWSTPGRARDRKYLLDVVRDSLVTHGHMLGICGAVFHADCVAFSIETGQLPGPADWDRFVRGLSDIVRVIEEDGQLSTFWLGAWERASGKALRDAILEIQDESRRYLDEFGLLGSYDEVLDIMECRGARQGAGMNTALAAAYACWSQRQFSIEDTLCMIANAIGSDTDTIATMAGAVRGAVEATQPGWPVQDREYIQREAKRMADVFEGFASDGFSYPDLSGWQAPSTQNDVLGTADSQLAMKGLGYCEPIEDPVSAGDQQWQWLRLRFGQTVLCKSAIGKAKRVLPKHLPNNQSAVEFRLGESSETKKLPPVKTRAHFERPKQGPSDQMLRDSPARDLVWPAIRSIDELTLHVIRSQFDDQVIGRCLKECAQGPEGVERSIAFAAIIAKALLARSKR